MSSRFYRTPARRAYNKSHRSVASQTSTVSAPQRRAKNYVKRTRGNRKLLDKKINTAVEVRMQQIAKKEIAKNRKLLTSRKYLFTDYDPNTNEFSVGTSTSQIDWTGRCVELSNIHKQDINFLANDDQKDDLDTSGVEAGTGDVGHGMVDKTSQGFRESDQIYIQSVSANLRIRSKRLADLVSSDMGTVKVHYAFVVWRDEEATMSNPLIEPDPIQLLNQPMCFGYSGKLDVGIEQTYHGLKKTVLCKGSCTLALTENTTSERWTTIYCKLPNPLKIQYDPQSQNGQICNKKIYFVIRASCPDSTNDALKPSVFCCSKLNYYEA